MQIDANHRSWFFSTHTFIYSSLRALKRQFSKTSNCIFEMSNTHDYGNNKATSKTTKTVIDMASCKIVAAPFLSDGVNSIQRGGYERAYVCWVFVCMHIQVLLRICVCIVYVSAYIADDFLLMDLVLKSRH